MNGFGPFVRGSNPCGGAERQSMNSIQIVEEAIKELKLQKRLIRQQHGRHDPTYYRAWVQNTIPYMLPILEKTLNALKWGTKDSDLIEEICFAAKITGYDLKEENRRQQTNNDYKKAKGLT